MNLSMLVEMHEIGTEGIWLDISSHFLARSTKTSQKRLFEF